MKSSKKKKEPKNTMEGNPKQLIVERIKNATNILVTVSRNPSVDALAAALGFTLMLNKMDKHATAVFSGALPDAISFLEPNKTFENTVDSLRDFIVALDKEKADRLRYKVEDDVVRIFITPYRTTITEADLNFSQGDFNVDLIVALGVDKKEDLDTAVTAHGRILHDATVVTVNAENHDASLGSIDWSDAGASSLCEMLMSLSEALQSGLLDEPIATSLLTGIVAATERFSNPHTTPKVMTMAAQLMAAGANQQLIASKLEEGHALAPHSATTPDGAQKLVEGNSAKVSTSEVPPAKDTSTNGEMQVEHTQPSEPKASPESLSAEDVFTHAQPVTPTLSVADLQKDLEKATEEAQSLSVVPAEEQTANPEISKAKVSDWRGKVIEPPVLGGTLSATSSEAEEEKLEEDRSSRNHTILTHDGPSAGKQAVNSTGDTGEPPSVDPFAQPLAYEETPVVSKPRVIEPIPAPAPPVLDTQVPPHTKTLAELEAEIHTTAAVGAPDPSSLDDARAAVDAALGTSPVVAPVVPSVPVSVEPVVDTPLPPPPPMPDFSSLPPLPPLPGEPQAPEANAQFPQQPPAADPGQFKIPGQ